MKENLLMVYSDFCGIWEPYAGLDDAEKQELKKEFKRRGVLKHMGHGVYRWKEPLRVIEEWEECDEEGYCVCYVETGRDYEPLEYYRLKDDEILYSDEGVLDYPTFKELYTFKLHTGRTLEFHELLSIHPANGLTFCKEDGFKHEHLIDYGYSGLMSPAWFKETYGR